ncbi:unnamed protein product [Peniophora sp. CBMAI 1063]|nr:unnamed protein product [Peniophora sp. CBMAI 1063]
MSDYNNSLQPADRLPTEVLAYIFSFLPDIYPPMILYNRSLPPLGWVCILHVCHLWREVARGSGKLWTRIETALGPTWAAEFVLLSGNQSIILDKATRSSGRRIRETILRVLENASQRLSVLRAGDTRSEHWRVSDIRWLIAALLEHSKSLGNLSTLSLKSPEPPGMPFPHQILVSVRHVFITSVMAGSNTDWASFPRAFQSIHLLNDEHYIPSGLQGLFGVVGRCDQLHTLEIQSSFMNTMSIDGQISLPALRSLIVSGESRAIATFLQAVEDLSSVVEFRSLGLGSSPLEMLAFVSTMNRIGATSRPYNSLCVYQGWRSHEVLVVGCYPMTDQPYAIQRGESTFHVTLRHDVDDAFEPTLALATTVLAQMDLSSVQNLVLKSICAPPEMWHKWFGRAVAVERLVLQGEYTLTMLRALALGDSQEPLRAPEDALLPGLQEIVTWGASMRLEVLAPSMEPIYGVGLLKDALVTRASLGCAPRRLHLTHCSADLHALAELVEAVPEDMREWSMESLTRELSRSGE